MYCPKLRIHCPRLRAILPEAQNVLPETQSNIARGFNYWYVPSFNTIVKKNPASEKIRNGILKALLPNLIDYGSFCLRSGIPNS